jgi:hypothetical protein
MASLFCSEYGAQEIVVDNQTARAEQRRTIAKAFADAGKPLDGVAFFCHGYPIGLQLGFKVPQVEDLADLIATHCRPGAFVALYACSTAFSKEGGAKPFAARLSEAVAQEGLQGVVIDAHTTAGHTTFNPYVKRYVGDTGDWLVRPHSLVWRRWRQSLPKGLWKTFPTMTRDEIHSLLSD